jgi:2-polyprenyl-3-methyl-5-hydroxy-6-metoxy-1,4-benzoquinol methylase
MYWRELHSYGDLWDGVMTPSPSAIIVQKGRRISLDILRKSLTGKKVLEIGAGKNFYTKKMQKWGYDVKATDIAYDNTNKYDVTVKPLKEKFDCLVAMGVLHHIFEDEKFDQALKNIKIMTKKRIILGVKIDSADINVAKQRPLKTYTAIFGEPIINEDAKYLNVLVFDVTKE